MDALREGDPDRLGGYKLVARLGAGGMGQVYLGRDCGGKLAAVKVAQPGLAEDKGFRARFARELATTRKIDAPWTAAVLDCDAGAAQPWLACEYVAGVTLERLVASAGPLSEPAVRILAGRMAQALAGLHSAGVVHRDVKPSNIVLADDGPWLIDFGIAKAIDATRITHTGMVLGTAGYMSPEQARDESVDRPSDVFSLASVLVFAATGRSPFGQVSNPVAMLVRICDEEPDLTGVGERLKPVLSACLAKEACQRPTAAELVADLDLADIDVDAVWPPASVTERIPALPRSATASGEMPTVAGATAVVSADVDSTVVPTVVSGAGGRGANDGRWSAAGVAGVAALAAVVVVVVIAAVWWVRTVGLPGSSSVPGGPTTYTTAAQISDAVDAQLRRDLTVKATSTYDLPSQYSHMVSEEQIRLDGDQTSMAEADRIHVDTPAVAGLPGGRYDFDGGMVVLGGRAWMTDSAGGLNGQTAPSWKLVPPQSSDPQEILEESRVREVSGSNNPLRSLAGAATVVDSHEDNVDGVPARRYDLRVDLNLLVQLQHDPRATPASGSVTGPSEMAMVWLDHQNHLLRYHAEQADVANGRGVPGTVVWDSRYRDWGLPVQIAPPPGATSK